MIMPWFESSSSIDIPVGVRLAAWRFKSQRAEYYEFLAELLSNRTLEQTLLLTFEQDSWRHGGASARGRLAAWWAMQYGVSGGDLVQTWRGTLPASDLRNIALAQQAGQGALVQTLASLAKQIRLWQGCLGYFWQTTAVALVALIVALSCLLVMPLWTTPRLTQAFISVPSQFYGASTIALINWVEWVSRFWWVLLLMVGSSLGLIWWSLSGLTGPIRDRLDRFGIWRLYRDLQAMRFLSGTATLLEALSASGVSLRTVLLTQQQQAGAWLSDHLGRMVEQLDAGVDALSSLNTGLLAGDVWWRFVDVVRINGLAQGLGTASGAIGQMLKVQLARRAQILRWTLLAGALACVMAVGLWHLKVIEELRQGLTLFYSLS